MDFWKKLERPFFVLAPMADVTDAAFRRMIAKYSGHMHRDGVRRGPDVMWTEFVSADGLMRAPEEGRKKLLRDLEYVEEERPIVAQLFTSDPVAMEYAAKLVAELGYDGVDINMGCPDRSIEKQGSGAALIKNPARAREIIRAAKRGMSHDGILRPVSVKTRLGYNSDILEEWLPEILAENPSAVTVHARTRKEMSKVPARWERVAKAVEIRNQLSSSARIIGNGDVISIQDAEAKIAESGADGAMVGRGVFGNPWFFHPDKDVHTVSLEERLRVMVEHTKLYADLFPDKNLAILKKHYRIYVNGFPGASTLRADLMNAGTVDDIERVVDSFLLHGHE